MSAHRFFEFETRWIVYRKRSCSIRPTYPVGIDGIGEWLPGTVGTSFVRHHFVCQREREMVRSANIGVEFVGRPIRAQSRPRPTEGLRDGK